MAATPAAITNRARLAVRLRLAVTRLNRRMRQQAESGLSPSAQSALATIDRHGAPSLGELAAHEGVRPPSITATVAALEVQGLVVRAPDPSDRRYFIGQVGSVSGSWMQRVAQSWLVLHLSGSGVALGVVSALQFLPMLAIGAWAGLLADRMDKRRLLVVTQALMGLLALALGVVTLAGVVQLWMVYLLALLLGVVTAID